MSAAVPPSPEAVTVLSGSRTDTGTDPAPVDGVDDLRAELANLLVRADGFEQPAACHWDYADALLAAGWVKATTDEPNAWRIEVTVPLRLPTETRHELFEHVVRAVGAWEPMDRDGWDTSVSGHPVHDDLLHDDPGAVLRGGEQP